MKDNKKTKKKGKAGKIIGNILFFSILGFLVTYYVWNFIDIQSGYKYPVFGMRSSVITSESMAGINDANTYITGDMQQIQKYDVITTTPYASYDEIQIYDVATYFDGQELVCHRVVNKYESEGVQYVIFRGDSNNVDDVPVSYDLVRGKVIGVTPQAGHVVGFLQSPYLFIAIFGSVFFICLAILIIGHKKDKKQVSEQASNEPDNEVVSAAQEEKSVEPLLTQESVKEEKVEEAPKEEPIQEATAQEEPVQEEPQKEEPLPVEETPVEETPNEQQEQEVPQEENKEVEETKPEPKPQKKAKKAAPKPTPKPETPVEKEEKKPVNFRTYHVSKRADGKWQVKYAGGSKAIKLFNTQKEAMEYTKVMAENQGGSVLLHNSKGANKGRIKKK